MIEPLTDEEILTIRKMLERRTWLVRGIIIAIGGGIGALIVSALQ